MGEERLQRRLAAILAADVVGYSRLIRADEEGTLATLQTLRKDIIDPKIAEYHGRVVKLMGDGMLAEFGSAIDAVRNAIAVQQAVAQHVAHLPEDRRVLFRVGINLGDVVIDGDDIHGDGVNVAARLESIADPGGVCISGAVYDQVRDRTDLPFEDLGEQDVKNLDRPVRVWRWTANTSSTAGAPTLSDKTLLLAGKPSIAVLPFENMSGDPEQEYFADGLTEDIIMALSLWRSFPVIARHSMFTYKGRTLNVQQVARELKSAYVLEGSVRKDKRRVRITAQLIDAQSGNQLWAQKFDRDLEDIFAVQDEITKRVAATVVPELEKVETKRSGIKQPCNLDAWDCYLRGVAFVHLSTSEGNVRAHDMFERALELDPAYGPAFTGLAYVLNRDLLLDQTNTYDDTAAKCLKAAKRAVELDEAAAISRTELVRALLWNRQHDAAIQEATKAVELNPANSVAHGWLGVALAHSGRDEEAIPWLLDGLDLAPRDPRSYLYMIYLALAYLSNGHPEKALEWARRAALRQSDVIEVPLILASILFHLGKGDEARQALDQISDIDLGSVERRPFWKRFKHPNTKNLVIAGLQKGACWHDR